MALGRFLCSMLTVASAKCSWLMITVGHHIIWANVFIFSPLLAFEKCGSKFICKQSPMPKHLTLSKYKALNCRLQKNSNNDDDNCCMCCSRQWQWQSKKGAMPILAQMKQSCHQLHLRKRPQLNETMTHWQWRICKWHLPMPIFWTWWWCPVLWHPQTIQVAAKNKSWLKTNCPMGKLLLVLHCCLPLSFVWSCGSMCAGTSDEMICGIIDWVKCADAVAMLPPPIPANALVSSGCSNENDNHDDSSCQDIDSSSSTQPPNNSAKDSFVLELQQAMSPDHASLNEFLWNKETMEKEKETCMAAEGSDAVTVHDGLGSHDQAIEVIQSTSLSGAALNVSLMQTRMTMKTSSTTTTTGKLKISWQVRPWCIVCWHRSGWGWFLCNEFGMLPNPTNAWMLHTSPLCKLVKGQEWHCLLAAHNMQTNATHHGVGQMMCKFWQFCAQQEEILIFCFCFAACVIASFQQRSESVWCSMNWTLIQLHQSIEQQKQQALQHLLWWLLLQLCQRSMHSVWCAHDDAVQQHSNKKDSSAQSSATATVLLQLAEHQQWLHEILAHQCHLLSKAKAPKLHTQNPATAATDKKAQSCPSVQWQCLPRKWNDKTAVKNFEGAHGFTGGEHTNNKKDDDDWNKDHLFGSVVESMATSHSQPHWM